MLNRITYICDFVYKRNCHVWRPLFWSCLAACVEATKGKKAYKFNSSIQFRQELCKVIELLCYKNKNSFFQSC